MENELTYGNCVDIIFNKSIKPYINQYPVTDERTFYKNYNRNKINWEKYAKALDFYIETILKSK